MKAQTITTPGGERLVMLPEAEFDALVEAAEDVLDRAAAAAFRRKLDTGEEELVPASVVDRILDGENRVKVWREHRGVSRSALAGEAGLSDSDLARIETGEREATASRLKKIAAALTVSLDDLVP